jgi:hypothetical protein
VVVESPRPVTAVTSAVTLSGLSSGRRNEPLGLLTGAADRLHRVVGAAWTLPVALLIAPGGMLAYRVDRRYRNTAQWRRAATARPGRLPVRTPPPRLHSAANSVHSLVGGYHLAMLDDSLTPCARCPWRDPDPRRHRKGGVTW